MNPNLEAYTWSQVCHAWIECLSTEFAGEKFPEFDQLLRTSKNFSVYMKIFATNAIDRGEDPQVCLNLFVKRTVNEGHRYGGELIEEICVVIDTFIKARATFPVELLFEPTYLDKYEGTVMISFEDEIAGYNIRGVIIDYVKPDASKYADWSIIEAAYWEDIPDAYGYEFNNEMRFSYLKHTSKYLQGL